MRTANSKFVLAAAAGITLCVGLAAGGCASSEPVGYQKTTTKTTNDTPTEKTTVTETREKNTTITPH